MKHNHEPGQAIGLRLLHRDEGALEEAYAAYAPAVRTYVGRFVGPHDAEDVVQRTFLHIWRHSARYDPAERLDASVGTVRSRASRGTRRLALLMTTNLDQTVRSEP